MSKFQELYERVTIKSPVVSEEKKLVHLEWMPFVTNLLEATGYTVKKLENGDVRASRDQRHWSTFKAHGVISTELFEYIIKQAVEGFNTVTEQSAERTEEILEAVREKWEQK